MKIDSNLNQIKRRLSSYIGSKLSLGLACNSINFTFKEGEFLYIHPLWRYEHNDKVLMTAYEFNNNFDDPQYKEDFKTKCARLQVLNGRILEGFEISSVFDLTLFFDSDHIVRQFHDLTTDSTNFEECGWSLFREQDISFFIFVNRIETY